MPSIFQRSQVFEHCQLPRTSSHTVTMLRSSHKAVPASGRGQGDVCTLQHGKLWEGKGTDLRSATPQKLLHEHNPVPLPSSLPPVVPGLVPPSSVRCVPKPSAKRLKPKHSAKGAEAQLISKALSTGYVLMSLGKMFKCDKPPRKNLKCGL